MLHRSECISGKGNRFNILQKSNSKPNLRSIDLDCQRKKGIKVPYGGILHTFKAISQLTSFMSSSHRGEVRVERPGRRGLRYVLILRDSWSLVSLAVLAGGVQYQPSLGLGGFHSHHRYKELPTGALMCDFLGLNINPYFWITSIRFCCWASCSASL